MKFTVPTLVAASTLALLAACGGGGDSTSQPVGNALAINDTNQSDVARASINGGLAISLAQGSLGGGGASSSAVVGRSHAMGAMLARVLRTAIVQRKGIASAGAHAATVSSVSDACAVGGSVTLSFDDKDGNNIESSGDVITAAFSHCQDSATTTLDGTIVVTLTSTPTQTQIAANVQFQNVSVLDSGATATISGSASINEIDGPDTTDSSIDVGSAGLTVGVVSTGYNDTLVFDAGTVVTTNESSANATTSTTSSGGFTSRFLGGHVTLTTPTALVQADADIYPGSGVIRVTGASGSVLLITVLDNSQVQLQLDANGDGTYESTTPVAWSALVP
jgi:hypothetical protein